MRKLSLLLLLLLGACGSNGQKTAEPAVEVAVAGSAPVGAVTLVKGNGVVDAASQLRTYRHSQLGPTDWPVRRNMHSLSPVAHSKR